MRFVTIAALAAAMSVAGHLPASAMTKEQATEQCKASLGTNAAKRASRNNTSVENMIAACVKRKMSGKKS